MDNRVRDLSRTFCKTLVKCSVRGRRRWTLAMTIVQKNRVRGDGHREGEAPAEPLPFCDLARREPRPPEFRATRQGYPFPHIRATMIPSWFDDAIVAPHLFSSACSLLF